MAPLSMIRYRRLLELSLVPVAGRVPAAVAAGGVPRGACVPGAGRVPRGGCVPGAGRVPARACVPRGAGGEAGVVPRGARVPGAGAAFHEELAFQALEAFQLELAFHEELAFQELTRSTRSSPSAGRRQRGRACPRDPRRPRPCSRRRRSTGGRSRRPTSWRPAPSRSRPFGVRGGGHPGPRGELERDRRPLDEALVEGAGGGRPRLGGLVEDRAHRVVAARAVVGGGGGDDGARGTSRLSPADAPRVAGLVPGRRASYFAAARWSRRRPCPSPSSVRSCCRRPWRSAGRSRDALVRALQRRRCRRARRRCRGPGRCCP